MIFEHLIDLLFPKRCVFCNEAGFWICPTCIKKIEHLDHFLIRQNFRHLSGTIAFFRFSGPLREAIHALKYEGVKELAEPLADLIVAQLKEQDLEFLGGRILIPVPLHRFKLASREFNHSVLLAEKLAEKLNLELEKDVLIKSRSTPAQIELKAKERKANLRGAFAVRHQEGIKNRKILLVDDVITTGATLDECAKVLKKAGARNVWALVLARD